MGFELIIKPVVFLDAEEAVKYYDAQLQGLGKRFYDNLLFSFVKIQTKPFAFSFVKKPVRKYKISRFPYKIFYLVTDKTIFIIGISHAKRSNAFVKKWIRLL